MLDDVTTEQNVAQTNLTDVELRDTIYLNLAPHFRAECDILDQRRSECGRILIDQFQNGMSDGDGLMWPDLRLSVAKYYCLLDGYNST